MGGRRATVSERFSPAKTLDDYFSTFTRQRPDRALVKRLRRIESESPDLVQKLSLEAEYFERNTQRMRYPEFRKPGLFVGSLVIEASCKTVIDSRLKQSGMFWTVRGANAIITLRCCLLNGRFENYREMERSA